VGSKHGVVWFDDGVGHLGSGVDAEFQLGLLSIVSGETLEEKSTETGTSSTTEGVEDKETLKTIAVIGESSNFIHDNVDDPEDVW